MQKLLVIIGKMKLTYDAEEKDTLEAKGLEEFAPRPFSNQPGEKENPAEKTENNTKPSDVNKNSNNKDGEN